MVKTVVVGYYMMKIQQKKVKNGEDGCGRLLHDENSTKKVKNDEKGYQDAIV